MRWAWIPLALLAAWAEAGPLTYRTAGASVRAVVEATSLLAGEEWAVDKQLAGEIVVVSIEKVEPLEFREKLAQVVSGRWAKKDDGTLLLEDDLAETRKRHETAQKAFVASIRSRVARMIEDLEKAAFREGSLAQHELSRLLPLYILRSVPDRVLEELDLGERVVLSTNPTRMQLALPNVLPKINELDAERVRRMDEKQKQEQPDVISYISRREITSCVFAIERFSHDNIGLTYGYGATGSGYQVVGTIFRPQVRRGTGEPIKWSPVAAEIARLFRSGSPAVSHGIATLSDSVIRALRDPVAHEPLAIAFGEGVLACGSSQGKNVVASMTDDDFYDWLAFAPVGLTTDDFFSDVEKRSTLKVTSDSDWLLIHPVDPVSARRFRGNREALKTLIDSSSGSLYPTVESLSKFASSNIALWRNSVPFRHIFAAVIGSDGGGVIQFDYDAVSSWRGLQLFDALGLAVRGRLQRGEKVSIGSLPLQAKDILRTMTFGVPQSEFGQYPEPTTVMPQGLPNDALLSAEVFVETILAPLPDGGELSTPPSPLGPQAVARIRIETERNQPTISLHRVRLGERTVWKFTLASADGKPIRKVTVCEDSVDPKGKIFTMSELPASVKSTLDEAERIERIRLFGG